MDTVLSSLVNGVAYGLLWFMLAAGLTLIFSMMGVLNFAHASFYMLGAYLGYQINAWAGFWAALIVAPLLVGGLGVLVEKFGLRRAHKYGHMAELLFTFGLAYIMVELVQLVWGRGPVPFNVPASLDGSAEFLGVNLSKFRLLMMGVSLFMLLALFVALTRTRTGLIVQAALKHPDMVEALGHDVPRVFMLVFGGGCALAGLAGVVGGVMFITEPGMAQAVGIMIFVIIVVGGLGSLAGAFVASILFGLITTFVVPFDGSIASALKQLGITIEPDALLWNLWNLQLSQMATLLPYLMMILVLIMRPAGLLGRRED